MATVRAGYLFLLSEPVLEAGLTVVLSTAASEVRVTKNFGADTAVELFGYRFGELKVVATYLNIMYSHSDLESRFFFEINKCSYWLREISTMNYLVETSCPIFPLFH